MAGVLRTLIACGLMAGAVYLLRFEMEQRSINNLLVLAACVPTGAAVFLAAAWAMRAPELKELLGPKDT